MYPDTEEEQSRPKSDEQKREDLVLCILIMFSEEQRTSIEIFKLHAAWEGILKLLEDRGLGVTGFYQDIVYGLYPDLERSLEQLMHKRFWHPHPDSPGKIFLGISPRAGHLIKKRLDSQQVTKLWELKSHILQLYREARTNNRAYRS